MAYIAIKYEHTIICSLRFLAIICPTVKILKLLGPAETLHYQEEEEFIFIYQLGIQVVNEKH